MRCLAGMTPGRMPDCRAECGRRGDGAVWGTPVRGRAGGSLVLRRTGRARRRPVEDCGAAVGECRAAGEGCRAVVGECRGGQSAGSVGRVAAGDCRTLSGDGRNSDRGSEGASRDNRAAGEGCRAVAGECRSGQSAGRGSRAFSRGGRGSVRGNVRKTGGAAGSRQVSGPERGCVRAVWEERAFFLSVCRVLGQSGAAAGECGRVSGQGRGLSGGAA